MIPSQNIFKADVLTLGYKDTENPEKMILKGFYINEKFDFKSINTDIKIKFLSVALTIKPNKKTIELLLNRYIHTLDIKTCNKKNINIIKKAIHVNKTIKSIKISAPINEKDFEEITTEILNSRIKSVELNLPNRSERFFTVCSGYDGDLRKDVQAFRAMAKKGGVIKNIVVSGNNQGSI